MASDLLTPLNKPSKASKPSAWLYKSVVAALFCLALAPFLLIGYWVASHDGAQDGRPVITQDISRLIALVRQPTTTIAPPPEIPEDETDPLASSGSNNDFARPDVAIDPLLAETTTFGLIPKIGDDGRRPEDVYAQRPTYPEGTSADGTPKVALVLIDVGQDMQTPEDIMSQLPSAITLAFSPYGVNLSKTAAKARSAGHELLMQIPLEPFSYPQDDPGPQTLLTSDEGAERLNKFNWALARINGYVGLANTNGGKFLSDTQSAGFLAENLEKRGLLFANLAPQSENKMPSLASSYGLSYLEASLPIDRNLDPDSIDQALLSLTVKAAQQGFAIGVSRPYPYVLKAIKTWSEGLAKQGVVLVPLSTLRNAELSTTDEAGLR